MKTTLRSQYLSCPSCVAKIEKALRATEGIEQATVHFTTGRIEVEHDDERIAPRELEKVVRSVGYEAKVSRF